MKQIIPFLRLMRPANLVTAVSDVWAGAAIAGYFATLNLYNVNIHPLLWLSLSTVCLYGGGVVFNDVFDLKIDRIERPERPLPAGHVSLSGAVALGACLLLIAIGAAVMVNLCSVVWALLVAVASLVYDKWGKHQVVLGPLNMGLCRGFNLLLGMSLVLQTASPLWLTALVPVIYIAAITMISRGEVHGGSRKVLYGAAALYLLVIASVFSFSIAQGHQWTALLFLTGFAAMIFPPLQKAVKYPEGPCIGKAVKAGVLALILMNAAWVAASGHPLWAVLTALLLPVSLLLARLFAVT
jgi:4-hydroxybenzoate polyprenyltransferase